AQSEAVTGKSLARYWLHNGMVKVDGEKMSKSLGNFTTIRDLLDRPVDPMALRLFVLMAQYRKPIDFTDDAIASATNGWQTLKEGLLFGHNYGIQLGWDNQSPTPKPSNPLQVEENIAQQFQEAVDDDLNFAGGLAVLFEVAKGLRREGNILVHQGKTETPASELEQQWRSLVALAQVLGLEAQPEEEAEVSTDGLSDGEIEALIQQRAEARKAKNFELSDRIRDDLQAQGITLIDQGGGVTTWHRN
ncbi:MAG: class I tRNA ligase family protein, partial [Moorea sp. SIO2I5]|nr:class I tRNA ligase family protein [Moorena sp. SIO2I5]